MKEEMICFDMDNTLVRSNKLHFYAFKKAFRKNKLPVKTNKEFLKGFSLSSSHYIKLQYPQLTKEEVRKVRQDHGHIVMREAKGRVSKIRGTIGVLKKCKKKHKVAVLSNSTHKQIFAILKAANIDKKLFNLIIGSDDVAHAKPAPDELWKAEKLLQIQTGYMVGDSIHDVQAGKKAGLRTIAVATGNHSKQELRKEKPWKILNTVAELPQVLKL